MLGVAGGERGEANAVGDKGSSWLWSVGADTKAARVVYQRTIREKRANRKPLELPITKVRP